MEVDHLTTVPTRTPVLDERASVKIELSVKRKIERLQDAIRDREGLRSRPTVSHVIDRLIEFHGSRLAA